MKQDALEPLLDDLRRRLRALYGERLEAVWLYGSRAREEARDESDVDVLVLLNGPRDRASENGGLAEIMTDLMARYGQLVTPLVVSKERFETEDRPVFRNIRREAVPLDRGDARPLRRRLQAHAPPPTYTDCGMKAVTDDLLGRARDALTEARDLFKLGHHSTAVSRAYYATYYAASAALNEAGTEAKSHRGTHDRFFRTYVRDGPLSREMSTIPADLQEDRIEADYAAAPAVSSADAEEALARAETFVEAVEDALGA